MENKFFEAFREENFCLEKQFLEAFREKFLVQLNIFLEAFKEKNFWFREKNFSGHSGREISNLDMRQSRMEIYGTNK